MPEGLPLALPVLSVPHFNLAPFSPQCRSPRLLMTPWRSQPARRSCVAPVGMCARVRCCVCRTSTSTLGASCAKVSVYLALCFATECPKLGFPATLLTFWVWKALWPHLRLCLSRILSSVTKEYSQGDREALGPQGWRHAASPELEMPVLEQPLGLCWLCKISSKQCSGGIAALMLPPSCNGPVNVLNESHSFFLAYKK